MKGVGWLCRVETSEKVSRALVTVPLPLIRYNMDISDRPAGAGSRYADALGTAPTSA